MTEMDVKRCVREVVTLWCGSPAWPAHKLGTLVPNLTAAQRQRLRKMLHDSPPLRPCAPFIAVGEMAEDMTVSALGLRVFLNKETCFGSQP